MRYNLTDMEEGNVSRRGERHWDWLSRQRCFNAQSIAIDAPWYSKSLEMSWHSAEKGPLSCNGPRMGIEDYGVVIIWPSLLACQTLPDSSSSAVSHFPP